MKKILLVAAAALATGTFLVTVPLFRHFFDLDVYRGAIRWWLLDGGRLYDFRFAGTVYGFTYPPFAALVLSRSPSLRGRWRWPCPCWPTRRPSSCCCAGGSGRGRGGSPR